MIQIKTACAIHLVCDDHQASLLQHTGEYCGENEAECKQMAREDGWQINEERATCPNCVKQQETT